MARDNRGERRDPTLCFDPRNDSCERPTRAVPRDKFNSRMPIASLTTHAALCARLMVGALSTGNKVAKTRQTRAETKHVYAKDVMSMRDDPVGEPKRAME